MPKSTRSPVRCVLRNSNANHASTDHDDHAGHGVHDEGNAYGEHDDADHSCMDIANADVNMAMLTTMTNMMGQTVTMNVVPTMEATMRMRMLVMMMGMCVTCCLM